MKYRTGFVSNSSSSSFIIFSANLPAISANGKEIPLSHLANLSNIWKDKEAFVERIWYNHIGWTEDDTTKEQMVRNEFSWIDKALTAMDEGKQVYEFSCDYNDESIERIMEAFDYVNMY